MENNNQKNEQLLLDMAKEVERKNKTIWACMWLIMGVSMTALLAGVLLAAFLIPEGIWQLVTVIGVCVLALHGAVAADGNAANGVQSLSPSPLHQGRAHEHGKFIDLHTGELGGHKVTQLVDEDQKAEQ